MNNKKTKRIIIILFSLVLAGCLAVSAFGVLLGIMYRPDAVAQSSLESNSNVFVYYDRGYLAFSPAGGSQTGLIFYPGAFVDYEAYAPLMHELAGRGLLCVVAEVPLNIALLRISAADSIKEHFPKVKDWYIGGHAHGGYAAAKYISKNADKYKGLILIASVPGADLSSVDISCLSVYGTNDGILSKEEYNNGLSKLPSGTDNFIIEGGNHSNFGNYSGQIGDNRATMTAEEQLMIAIDKIADFTGASCTAQESEE